MAVVFVNGSYSTGTSGLRHAYPEGYGISAGNYEGGTFEPPPNFAKLAEAHRLSVVEVFTSLLLRRKMGVAGAVAKLLVEAMANRQTGDKSSRASSGSSAAHRPTGSKKRRRRS
jgi:hypothetical protein